MKTIKEKQNRINLFTPQECLTLVRLTMVLARKYPPKLCSDDHAAPNGNPRATVHVVTVTKGIGARGTVTLHPLRNYSVPY